MKHVKVDGQMINTEKKWQHLHCQQREWIVGQFREEYVATLNKSGTHPNKEECREIVDRIYEKIKERGIWIHYDEVRKAFSAKLPRYRKIEIATIE